MRYESVSAGAVVAAIGVEAQLLAATVQHTAFVDISACFSGCIQFQPAGTQAAVPPWKVDAPVRAATVAV